MTNPSFRTRAFTLAALAFGALVFAGCSPEQQQIAQAITKHLSEVQTAEARSPRGPGEATLDRLRRCESGGNYRAVSRRGSFRGAYQFRQSTWNNVARGLLPEYVGVDPAQAPWHIQDAMARVLWSQSGPGQWPVCGRRAR